MICLKDAKDLKYIMIWNISFFSAPLLTGSAYNNNAASRCKYLWMPSVLYNYLGKLKYTGLLLHNLSDKT